MAQFILPRKGILAFMDDDSRGQFTAFGSIRDTVAGEVVIQEGQPNNTLFVVVSGAYNVCTSATGQEVHLDVVGAGDCLGEVAVFQPGRASATVTSAGEGRLWCITVERLQQFLIEYPRPGCAAVLGVNTILSRRLKRANTLIRSNQILPGFLSVRSKKRAENMNVG